MKIALGCDHGALELKNALIPFLRSLGHSVEDFGTYTPESCDYPDYAVAAAQAVADGDCDRGIVLCTTGIGVSIAANKVRGIRCALLSDLTSARMTRLHNDTNMMALGAGVVSQDLAFAIVDAWLSTPFSNEDRHQRRIDKVMSCERGLKKKRRSPDRRRRRLPLTARIPAFIVSRLVTVIISILLILSMVITPITTYVTSIADPSYLVDILFSSGLFGNAPTPEESPTDGPAEETTGPSDSDDLTGDLTDDTLDPSTEGSENATTVDDGETGDTPVGGETDTSVDGGETGNTPDDAGEPAVASLDDTGASAADGENTDTPVDGGETDTPVDGGETDTSVDGGETDTPADGSETDTPADGGETDTPADDSETDTPADDSETDTPADGGEADTPADDSETDTPADDGETNDSNLSAAQDLLAALQGMIGSDMIDEDTLHTMLNIPAESSIDTTLLGEKLLASDAAQALVSAYVSDAVDAAMGGVNGPTLTGETVMDIVTPHIGQLVDIVEECLPEGTEIDRATIEDATLQALEVALPSVVDSLPDLSEAAAVLKEQSPAIGTALDVLKFIRTGALRAAAFLLVVVLIVVLCLFRLPGLNGLRCVGICGMIGAALCGGIYLLLTMPTLPIVLEGFGSMGTLINQFAESFAHEFAVYSVIYGVSGLFLILGTTILRGFFGMLFDAIFSRD